MDVIPPNTTPQAGTRLHAAASPAADRGVEADAEWSGSLQVLALDGGGAKALFTAYVLAQLEEDLGVVVADSFDLIAGTSAGGIIALALGAGLRPAEIVERYEALIEHVFPSHRRRWWRRSRQLFRPMYDADALRQALTGVFGDLRVGDSRKRLIVPSWDVQRGGVHIFKTPHHDRLRRDWRTSMVDVANATAAAPLYFPAARVGGLRLIDGGVWANNPSVLAIAEATSMLGAPIASVRVLNVGTMEADASHGRKLDTAGLLGWARPAAPTILNASSRGGQGIAEHLVGPNNYVRFDAHAPKGAFALDAVDRDDVVGLATSASRTLAPTYRAQFAAHRAVDYTPAFSIPAPTGSPPANRPEVT